MPKRTFTKEADVKAEVKKILNTHKWFWWCPAANGYGRPGASDFMALRGGVFLAVETKFGNSKPTAAQRAFLESVAAEDGFGFVVNEVNLPAFRLFLEQFDLAAQAVSGHQEVAPESGAAMLDCIKLLTELVVAQ